ncbi:MAG: hypothetical protein GKS00_10235 [Alphaproteobacteria bacterium]|nr:hypothetical protein [Alphaproteobacteria bacterium]
MKSDFHRFGIGVRRVLGSAAVAAAVTVSGTALAASEGHDAPRKMSPGAKPVEHDSDKFGPNPSYKDKPYDAEKQIEIYGGKTGIDAPRPAVELGRPIYVEGAFGEGINLFGEKNLLFPAFNISGDWRTAVAFNDNGDVETGQIATRLNLEVDLKLTATERLHAFIRPLDQGGKFTRYEFFGDDRDQGDVRFDVNLQTLFFEGDLGAMYQGFSGNYTSVDLPVSFGLMPVLFQNGVWAEDAFIGGAFAIPALNSRKLDISNMDFTFFGGFDKVTTPAIKDAQGNLADHGVNVFGVAAFVEAMEGYWEAGLGRIEGDGNFDDLSYNSATIAFTRRYGRRLSNSVRAIYTFGQDADNVQQTADGLVLLVENSLITSLPSTLIPYFNAWIGLDRPQPLADDTGVLKNTGINFETDALTGFPKLDDTANDTFGGAIGLQYLFNLDQQIVVEAAMVQALGGNDADRNAKGDQYALGIRYQLPISQAWIVRADAIYGWLENVDDISGARIELRRKF